MVLVNVSYGAQTTRLSGGTAYFTLSNGTNSRAISFTRVGGSFTYNYWWQKLF